MLGDRHCPSLGKKNVVHKLFNEAENRFSDTKSGYTRVVRLGRRPGDSAPMSLVELVAAEAEKKKKERKKKKPVVAQQKPAEETREPETTDTGVESSPAEDSARDDPKV